MRGLALAVALVAVSLAPGLAARGEPPPPKDWEIEILPYVWGAITEGSVELPQRGTEHFHVGLADLLGDLDLGAMGRLNARYERWVLVLDGVWAKLNDDSGSAEFEEQLGLAQAFAGYRLFRREGGLFGTPRPADERVFGFDLLGGASYAYFSSSIDIDAPIADTHVGASKDFVAPFVGVRLQNDFTPRLRLETLAGAGSFGVGNAPDFSWQVTTLLSYRFTDHLLVSLGHRAVVANDDDVDISVHGPLLGLGVRF